MKESEYRELQSDLTYKMERHWEFPPPSQKYRDGYREGLLAAKSILSSHQKRVTGYYDK